MTDHYTDLYNPVSNCKICGAHISADNLHWHITEKHTAEEITKYRRSQMDDAQLANIVDNCIDHIVSISPFSFREDDHNNVDMLKRDLEELRNAGYTIKLQAEVVDV